MTIRTLWSLVVLCYGLGWVVRSMLYWLLYWLVLLQVSLYVVQVLWLVSFVYRLGMSKILDLEGLKIKDLVFILIE